MMKNKDCNKYLWFFPYYFILFILIERLPLFTSFHEIHCALDDKIPFCEYFIVPYVLWMVLIPLFLVYTYKNNTAWFKRFMSFMILAWTMVWPIFLLYPSQVHLRPEALEITNVFRWMCSIIYTADTPTNVCPSMHVIGMIGLLLASWDVKPLNKPVARLISVILTLLVCASTLFMRQHSVLDVIAALPVTAVAAWFTLGYREKAFLAVRGRWLRRRRNKKTVPSLGTYLRQLKQKTAN